jgi:hypothetical protein
MLFSSGLEPLDPALLAFIKCHVTSAARWEVLRLLAGRNGEWLSSDELARHAHVRAHDLTAALANLVDDGLVECREGLPAAPAVYRLPVGEPTSVVLQRLIQTATHSQEARAIIAAHLQRTRRDIKPLPSLTPSNPIPSTALG